ncbi:MULTISPECIES: hypothetical protein [Streptomyces]|uniref:hypothetical protein n=1 Tax=Streptomyces TaxID=1883 RepID=UPI00103BC4E2|nr:MULTISPECIES: hypothetical protein [Streptomyces]MBT3077054.1 hypothetical protein [Streptomyces sp. COG21]MBT3082370.1 hypothetical protein [Streptomyces sp. COG20]MBT3104343.1 hypothetical protein [Streptomyces sp. COG19]MBT3110648.1 hypothetical protein [Streptomyces sp. CYG20]MDI7785372.1 hypothetical protein [Streptomyces cavourensis]
MGLPSRSIHLAACALAAGALLTGLVPASGALAAPVAPTVRAAAEDPPTEDMPDDGFDDEHEGEQDDLVGPGGTASGQRAPGVRAAPVPGRAGDFRLAAGSDLSGLVGRLDAALPKQGLTALMEQANRTAGWEAACGNTSIYGPDLAVNHRVCWADDDLASTEWVPQAITGVSDAQEDEDWGTSNAEPIAVASYDAKNPGRSDQASGSQNCVQPAASDACNEKGVRVSFFNQATQKYRHVLLVWPYVNSKNNISFDALHASEGTCTGTVTPSCKAQNGIHAGGMVWYGNYLYVADTANGMRVFDLRKIMDLNPDNDADRNDPTPDGLESDVKDKKRIGRQNNVWYSFGYRYVMPQVATLKFTTAKNGGTTAGNQCYATGRPKASFLSLDRTGADHLILGEYCNKNNGGTSNGRVGTYPMSAITAAVEGAPGTVAAADSAFGLPTGGTFNNETLWHKIQGALRYEGTWYFHRSNAYSNGRLLQATPGTVDGTTQLVGNTTILQSSYGPEDLYLAHGRGDGFAPQLWSLSEHAPSASCPGCKRELYSYNMSEVIGDFGS